MSRGESFEGLKNTLTLLFIPFPDSMSDCACGAADDLFSPTWFV